MNRFWRSLFPCLLVLLLGGCLTPQHQLRLENDIEEMKRRLAEVERTMANRDQEQDLRARLDTLARQQADLQASFDTQRVENQGIGGRFEDLTRQNRDVHSELSLLRDDLGLKLGALEGRVAKLADQVAVATAPPPVPENPEALYEQGLDLIQKKGDYPRGEEVLQDFLKRFPQHELAANAMYWIGEGYYGEKKYENAILQFQDVIQKYPEHSKAPAAMLKQGLAFQALGDLKNAKVILKKVIESYPKTEEATKARDRLALWGGN